MDDLQGYCTCNNCGTHQKVHKEVQVTTRELYNQKDKAEVRDLLLKEQDYKCAITGLPLDKKEAVLEHRHDDEMFVRGVASRAANSALGVLENAFKRYLQWWYNGSLSDFLRQCASYLEQPIDRRFRHDEWLKKSGILFNKLSEGQKKEVLHLLGQPQGNNATERRKLFRSALMTRKFSYEQVKAMIQERKK